MELQEVKNIQSSHILDSYYRSMDYIGATLTLTTGKSVFVRGASCDADYGRVRRMAIYKGLQVMQVADGHGNAISLSIDELEELEMKAIEYGYNLWAIKNQKIAQIAMATTFEEVEGIKWQ